MATRAQTRAPAVDERLGTLAPQWDTLPVRLAEHRLGSLARAPRKQELDLEDGDGGGLAIVAVQRVDPRAQHVGRAAGQVVSQHDAVESRARPVEERTRGLRDEIRRRREELVVEVGRQRAVRLVIDSTTANDPKRPEAVTMLSVSYFARASVTSNVACSRAFSSL